MTRSVRSLLALSSVFFFNAPALAGSSPEVGTEPVPKITVRVYNYAQVSSRTLGRATEEATRVFQVASVELEMLDCLLEGGETNPGCARGLLFAPLDLRIIRANDRVRARYGKKTTGYALRSEDGSGGELATVFYDRVEEEAWREGLPHGLVLGHAMAHELGHLLLPSGAHSPSGLMCANLRRKEWQLAAVGQLLFSAQEAQLIRAEVRSRIRQQEGAAQAATATSRE